MSNDWFTGVRVVVFIAMVLVVLGSPVVMAANGEEILRQRCIQCHELDGAGPDNLHELWAQKGPNFSYAGNKYKQDWIEQWLTAPVRIRPAGMYYGKHIKPGKEHDKIDEATLADHVALKSEEAKAVASAMMSYKGKSKLITKGAYKPGKISLSMGDMIFIKFRGCLSCHRIDKDYGGVSGPEVYTAAKRLQEDYLISFMKNPQAWSPLTYMPQYHLKDKDLQKFVHYFRALAEENN